MKEKVCPVCGSTHLKQGKFIPGTGHPVLAPADISFETVSCILVENDVYLDEIKRQTAEIDTVFQSHPSIRYWEWDLRNENREYMGRRNEDDRTGVPVSRGIGFVPGK